MTNSLFRFSEAGYSVRETATVANVEIERYGLTNDAAEIQFVAGNGTAMAGADFDAMAEAVVFAPDQLTTPSRPGAGLSALRSSTSNSRGFLASSGSAVTVPCSR